MCCKIFHDGLEAVEMEAIQSNAKWTLFTRFSFQKEIVFSPADQLSSFKFNSSQSCLFQKKSEN